MKAEYVPYRDTGYFSRAVLDYLDADAGAEGALRALYSIDVFTHGSFEKALEIKAAHKIDRQALVDVLSAQYGLAGPDNMHPSVLSNISSLREAGTYTVACGHQLNIFSGPLYTIYKILSTIRLAEDLNASGKTGHVVPVFWMATEDNDFAEINHLKLGGKTITWDLEASGAVGRLSTETLRQTLVKVLSSLGLMPFSAELENLCQAAYGASSGGAVPATLAEATRYFYNELFGRYGLVILDADDSRLKKLFIPVVESDIFSSASYNHVTASNNALESAGYKVQVHPREINFFYLVENFRERIVFAKGGGYRTLGGEYSWTAEDMHAEIRRFPERFSPNVILRPLYQEAILPNLGFIGGGAEVTYWLSLRSTFEHYQIPYPVLMLRNSAMLINAVSLKRIHKLGFTAADLFKDPRQLIKQYIFVSSTRELELKSEHTALSSLMEGVRAKAAAIDPSLSQSTLSMLTRMQHLLEKLEKKMLKAEKNRFDTEMVQIFKLHEDLFPGNSLQEREENFLPYYARYGPAFLDWLKDSFTVPGKDFTLIYLSEAQ